MRLGGKFPYAITGPVPNGGKICYQWNYKLCPKQNPILSPEAPDSHDCYPTDQDLLWSSYFAIQVPRPKIFYALNLVGDTEVIKSGDCKNDFTLSWSTGFRLYYDWQPDTQIYLDTPKVPPACEYSHNIVTPPSGRRESDPPGWLPLANDGDIEIQFESSSGDDLQHSDAMQCFAKITKLANLDWWLNFRNGEIGGGGTIHSGGDCLAIPMAIGINN
jgi:hypothetical protein